MTCVLHACHMRTVCTLKGITTVLHAGSETHMRDLTNQCVEAERVAVINNLIHMYNGL